MTTPDPGASPQPSPWSPRPPTGGPPQWGWAPPADRDGWISPGPPPPPGSIGGWSAPTGPPGPPGLWSPPDPPVSPAPAPPRRTGRLALVLGAVAVATLAALATAALVVRAVSGDGGGAGDTDFGSGPRSEPSEEWSVAVDGGPDGTAILSDGERVYVLTSTEGDDYSTTTTVTAYAASDGATLWTEDAEASTFDTPLRLLGDQVLLSEYGEATTTRLLDATTGEEVWEADGMPPDDPFGFGLPPFLTTGPTDVFHLVSYDGELVAVDRSSGEELWHAAGTNATICDDVVLLAGESDFDLDTLMPMASEIVAHHPRSGEELWTSNGVPGPCHDDLVALTGNGEVTVLDAHTGDRRATISLGRASGSYPFTFLFGDFVAATSIVLEEEGAAHSGIYAIADGEATWEDEGAFLVPISDDLAIAGNDSDDDAILIRAHDGAELDRIELDSEDNTCSAVFARDTIVLCDGPDVTSYAFSTDGYDELWTIDAGADVSQVAVGGDRLFVLTDGTLAAYR